MTSHEIAEQGRATIYYFDYRGGEIIAKVHADCECEAWARLLSGEAIIVEVNQEILDDSAWELGDTEEEDYDRQ